MLQRSRTLRRVSRSATALQHRQNHEFRSFNKALSAEQCPDAKSDRLRQDERMQVPSAVSFVPFERHGVSFHVLEARERVGGRILNQELRTKRVSAGGCC